MRNITILSNNVTIIQGILFFRMQRQSWARLSTTQMEIKRSIEYSRRQARQYNIYKWSLNKIVQRNNSERQLRSHKRNHRSFPVGTIGDIRWGRVWGKLEVWPLREGILVRGPTRARGRSSFSIHRENRHHGSLYSLIHLRFLTYLHF